MGLLQKIIMGYCLGLKFLGYCNEYFQYQYSVYNLGASLAAIAIILVLWQLLKPLYYLRFEYRKKLVYLALALFAFNIVSVFISAFIPYIPGPYVPLLSYPIFWEILGAVFFVISVILLLTIFLKKITRIRSKDNLIKLYSLSVRYVAEGEDKHNALAAEFAYYLPNLLKFYQTGTKEEIAYVSGLLEVMSDADLCKIIAIKEPRVMIRLFNGYRSIPRGKGAPMTFLRQLLYQSFSRDNSVIARELKREGVGTVNSGRGIVLDTLLKDYQVIGRYRPFGEIASIYEKYDEIYINNFSEFWRQLLEAFFHDVEASLEYSESLLDGFKRFNRLISLNEGYISMFWCSNLRDQITRNSYKIVDYYKKIPEIPKTTYGSKRKFYDKYKDNNFFGILAQGIYLLLEPNKKIQGFPDERNYFLDVYHILDQGIDRSKPIGNTTLEAIQKRLYFMLEGKIKDDNLRGYYPMMLRIFFEVFGYGIFTHPEKISSFDRKIMKMVAKKLPNFAKGYIWYYPKSTKGKVLEANKEEAKKIIKNMLPGNMIYERKSNALIYTYSKGRNSSKIKLDSVLKNEFKIIKLKH